MKGNTQVLQHLNKILRHQLTHINQYFLHARMLNNAGFDKLGNKVYKQSIREMKNADTIIERILLLEGLPNLQDLGKLYIGEVPEEMIACDLRTEAHKKEDFLTAVICCEQEQDYVTRQLLVKQKDDNEEYIDFLENQQELIGSLGINNYLQTVIE
ncbi:MAG: bacterioferritin [Gammaproteobacteria bacterium]|nr:bacterioferritin [Gammaproteobacteria bacterium]